MTKPVVLESPDMPEGTPPASQALPAANPGVDTLSDLVLIQANHVASLAINLNHQMVDLANRSSLEDLQRDETTVDGNGQTLTDLVLIQANHIASLAGDVGRQMVDLANRSSLDNLERLQREQAAAARIDGAVDRIAGLEERLSNVENATTNLSTTLINTMNAINQATLDQRLERMASEARVLESVVRSRYAMPFAGAAAGEPPPLPGTLPSLEEYEARLKALAPLSWDAFVACRDTGTDSYLSLPETSCSTERHPQAHLFRAFVRPYLKGAVLDIGCGPQPVPFYLQGYPTRALSGIDPISSPQDHPFQFVSGYGEFLPWGDEVFDVVISGTVLDHYYLLDRGLSEVFRTLKPGGKFLAWITHFADAPRYDPYAGAVTAYDHEHMYHINLEWFRPLMHDIGFVENEIIEFPLPFRFLFMSFEKPVAAAANPEG